MELIKQEKENDSNIHNKKRQNEDPQEQQCFNTLNHNLDTIYAL